MGFILSQLCLLINSTAMCIQLITYYQLFFRIGLDFICSFTPQSI